MIAPNTPENTPVLVNGQRGKVLLMWTDGTADVRMDDGQTLIDVPLQRIYEAMNILPPDLCKAINERYRSMMAMDKAPCRTCGGDCTRPQLCPNFFPDWMPTKENA